MPATTRMFTTVLLAAATVLTMAASQPPALTGTYRADCAPYDGSAFRITLAAPHGQNLELTANVPLAGMAGSWVHSDDSGPGMAMLLLCRESPARICSYPRAGRFSVSGKAGSAISGRYDARFANGFRLSGTYRARPARNSGRMLCG